MSLLHTQMRELERKQLHVGLRRCIETMARKRETEGETSMRMFIGRAITLSLCCACVFAIESS